MRAALALGLFLAVPAPLVAQTNVALEIDDVTDNRISPADAGAFQMRGSLDLRVKLTGKDLDKAAGARVIVKEAKDDKGNSLVSEPVSIPDFTPREYNSGTVQLSVHQPAREAAAVRIKGTVELYVPARDPNATVRIDNALARRDAPLSSGKLKAAKVGLTLLSAEGYAALLKSRRITEADIEKIRAEAKKQGADEKDVELAIELARAFEQIDEPPSPNSVYFSGRKADFDRIFRLEILGPDGNPINVPSRGVSTRGETAVMTLNPSEPPPQNAAVQIMLLTDKARVSFPFDLKVPLP